MSEHRRSTPQNDSCEARRFKGEVTIYGARRKEGFEFCLLRLLSISFLAWDSIR